MTKRMKLQHNDTFVLKQIDKRITATINKGKVVNKGTADDLQVQEVATTNNIIENEGQSGRLDRIKDITKNETQVGKPTEQTTLVLASSVRVPV